MARVPEMRPGLALAFELARDRVRPAKSADWKNIRQVVDTPAAPPNPGRICLAIRGCTRNSRNVDRKTVAANSGTVAGDGRNARL